MAEKQQNTLWFDVMVKWLMGSIYGTAKIIWPRQVKVMTRAMSLVFVNSLLRELTASGKVAAGPQTDENKAMEHYRNAEVEAGIVPDATKVEILPEDDGSVTMTFHACPYGKLCNEALAELLSRGDFNKATIPCFRMETYSACVSLLTRVKRGYRLVQFAPGARCQGELVPARTSPMRG